MKKAISLLLALIMGLTLCACGNKAAAEEPTEPVVKYALGETVSTDLADFTLEDSVFTYYVSNVSTNYVEPMDEPNELFNASIGHCYVSLTFTIANKDRGGSISFAGFSSEWSPKFQVSYNGAAYPVNGFDLNDNNGKSYLDLGFSAVVDKDTGKVIEKHDSGNYLLSAGETVTLRAFGVIAVEPENLTDGFDLTVSVLNSQGVHEQFIYTVPGR